MIIKCPHCGERDSSEFYFRGEYSCDRPTYDAGQAKFADYVYGRDNIAGVGREHWYHSAGCRNWLIVERDTRTHAIDCVVSSQGMQP